MTICSTIATISPNRNDRYLDPKPPFKHTLAKSSYTSRITFWTLRGYQTTSKWLENAPDGTLSTAIPKPVQRLTALLHHFDPHTHLTQYHCSVSPCSSYAQIIVSWHVSCLLTCTACILPTYTSLTRHMLPLHFPPISTCLRSHGISRRTCISTSPDVYAS